MTPIEQQEWEKVQSYLPQIMASSELKRAFLDINSVRFNAVYNPDVISPVNLREIIDYYRVQKKEIPWNLTRLNANIRYKTGK